MKEVGEFLKSKRLEKGLKLEEISAHTKIQLEILEAIEKGQKTKLPHTAHLKGFIRQYIRIVGIDENEVWPLLDLPSQGKHRILLRDKKDEDEVQTNILWFRAPSKLVRIIGILVVIGLLGLVYVVYEKMDAYSKEKVVIEDIPQEEASDTEITETPAPSTTEPSAEAKKAPTVNKEKQSLGKSATAASSFVAVEAIETVDLVATWSTGKEERFSLEKDHKHTFFYTDKISLQISNGGHVRLKTHEKSLGVPGKIGEPTQLEF